METQTMPETKAFYSRYRGLCLRINKGQLVQTGSAGALERTEEKSAQFYEHGKFGRFVTSDPETIEVLEKLAKKPDSDILTQEDYDRVSVPVDVKLAVVQDENEKLKRTLFEQNKLLAEINARNARQGK